MIPDTGQTATAVFDLEDVGDDFVARFTMLGELQRIVDSLEATALDTEDEKEFVPGDLVDPGEIEAEFWWDATKEPPDARVKATLTVTLPLGEGQVAAASWTASGFFTLKLIPSMQTNTLSKGKTKFKLDGRPAASGGTKFTFTPATTA